MTTDNKKTVDALQQAFDDFKLVYLTCTMYTKKELLQDACDLFKKAYDKNNIGLCKKVLLTLTDADRKKALQYIEYIGLSVLYNIKKDDLQIRRFADYDKDKENASFADFVKNQSELTKENNKAELQQDLTKYQDKATKQIQRIFADLTAEQKTIFKNIINNLKF